MNKVSLWLILLAALSGIAYAEGRQKRMKQTKKLYWGILILFFIYPSISFGANITDGLVGYWQFKNSLVNTQSGEQGSLMNGANFSSGKLGQGLNFDGVDDYFQPASNSALNNLNSITITAWINERSMGGNGLARGRIIEKGNGAVRRFVLLAGDEDNLQFNAGYGATTAATFKTPSNSLSKNAWHYVAVTYTFGDPANIPNIYIDGVKQQTIPNDISSGSPVADDNAIFIGGGRRSWDGLIDEVRIYNRILTSSEINTVYAYENPPNIVVIMSDDQEASSLGIMGNVKRFLSDQGVRFINSFVNYPLCCPSRASFLTGQAAHNTGIVGNSPGEGGGYEPFMRQEGNTLPVWLQGAGYHTAVIGKYLNSYGDGVTSSTTHIPPGWDTVNLLPDSLGTYYYYNYSVNINGALESHGASSADYQTDVLAQKAVDYIKSRQSSAQPFFLWLTPMAPHDSLAQNDEDPFSLNAATPPLRYLGSYDNISIPMPPNFNEADVSDKPLFVRNRPLFDAPATAMTINNWRRKQETILGVDDMVARVVSELQNTGKLDNTFIVYTSDNGWANGQHRRVTGKRNVYEEIIQVPLVMRGPGIPAGQTRTQLVDNLDLVATIEDLAHAAPGRTPDGSSLLPIISNQNTPWRTGLLIEGTDGNNPWQTFINGKEYWPGTLGRFFAIRTPNYLYAEHTTPDIGFEREFYDLSKDPYQLESKPNDPVYASVVNGLQSILSNLKSCVGASCFVTSPEPILTITPPPAPAPTPTPSVSPRSSGDGGSGGGGTVLADKSTSSTIVITRINKNEDKNINVNSEAIALTSISLKPTRALSNVELSVIKLQSRPAAISLAPAPRVFQYLDIAANNVLDSSISLSFCVPLSWVQQNAVDISTIALYRFTDGAWQKLPTIMVSKDGQNLYFAAQTPGFSLFAIGGQPQPGQTSQTLPSDTPQRKAPLSRLWRIPLQLIKHLLRG